MVLSEKCCCGIRSGFRWRAALEYQDSMIPRRISLKLRRSHLALSFLGLVGGSPGFRFSDFPLMVRGPNSIIRLIRNLRKQTSDDSEQIREASSTVPEVSGEKRSLPICVPS